MRIGIICDDVDALRVDALWRLGQPDHASILGFGIAEHAHAVAEHELSISDSAAFRWNHHLLLESERLAQPVDRRASIPIA
jgi:hypothetical protein